MEVPVIVALIGSATSIVMAVWSLVTAQSARRRAVEAEEFGKRSEQIRIKATEAAATVMSAVTDYMLSIESIMWLIENQGGMTESTTLDAVKPVVDSSVAMRRCVLENAIYLTKEIVDAVEKLAKKTEIDFNLKSLSSRLCETQQLHDSLSKEFRNLYLDPMMRPHNMASQLTANRKRR